MERDIVIQYASEHTRAIHVAVSSKVNTERRLWKPGNLGRTKTSAISKKGILRLRLKKSRWQPSLLNSHGNTRSGRFLYAQLERIVEISEH